MQKNIPALLLSEVFWLWTKKLCLLFFLIFFMKLTDVFRLEHAGVEELTVHVGHPENEVGVGIARTQVTTEYHPVISGI